MTQLVLNREQSRRVDQRAHDIYGISGLVLMENAGRGAVDVLQQHVLPSEAGPGPIVICCGRGNNGGYGFVMARHLDARGFDVWLIVLGEPDPKSDAGINFSIAQLYGIVHDVYTVESFDETAVEDVLASAGCVIDALLGTGFSGEPRPPFDRIIHLINKQPVPIVAVDLPSGLDCDTGAISTHTVRASHTITFVATKPGLLESSAAPYVGEVYVVDLGLPPQMLNYTIFFDDSSAPEENS